MTDPIDHTSLAEQIASEHRPHVILTGHIGCSCQPDGHPAWPQHVYVRHIITVTERAVRERVRAAGPTLEIQAWGATPEQADAIFTAAMDAAYDAAPEGVAVDAVGRLAGGAVGGSADPH